MGRRKNLPETDRLNGYPSHSRRPDFGIDVVQAEGDVFIPEHLSDDAQACIEVIKSSMPPGTYAKADSFLLSAFATAWAIHKQASFKISAPDFDWIVINNRGNGTSNPTIRIATQQALIMASLGDRLGLSPKARACLRLPTDKPKSKFDGLTGGAKLN